MKGIFTSIMSMTMIGIALALTHPWAAPAATVVISPPVVVTTPVPETYVWDGAEYVGVVNGQYYYLGPGNVWIALDSQRMNRFHAWQHSNPNWQAHATHNTRYRGNNHVPQPQPMRHVPPPNPNQNSQHNGDGDHGHQGP
jgi:hypothetical protein